MGESVKKEINLIKSVKSIITPYCFKGAKKGVNVWAYYELPIDEVFIGDAENLNQAIVDLMENAINNTVEGHIVLDVKQIKVSDAKTILQFSVRHLRSCKDNGAEINQIVCEIKEGTDSKLCFNAELERKAAVNS